MSKETEFLQAILADPSDEATKLVYSDWLEDQGDRRDEGIRLEVTRLRHADEENPLDSEEDARYQRLLRSIDRDWLAFVTTLARPFRQGPVSREFFDVPREDLPFSEPIGLRGSLMTFDSQFRTPEAWDSHLLDDLFDLMDLEFHKHECAYGAASMPLHPFLCEFEPKGRPLTGRDVLEALKARNFRSEHIPSLDATNIAYPGYHSGTDNDEIHNELSGQNMFEGNEQDGSKRAQPEEGVHGRLKASVADGKLWYVLLHTEPHAYEEFMFSDYVVLFAVGLSLRGPRLLGAITHQVCHNLCD